MADKTQKKLSPYLKRKAMIPEMQRLFGPWRDRSRDKDTLHQFWKDHPLSKVPLQSRRMRPRFWQLPPEQRSAAEAYEYQLCLKWKDRIKVKPNFKNILHMIAVNQFKNPGQSKKAWDTHRCKMAKDQGKVNKMRREVFGDPQPNAKPSEPHAPTGIYHLPL